MYAWIWRRLPGPTPVRLVIALALVAALVLLLFEVVFPAVEQFLPYSDVRVS